MAETTKCEWQASGQPLDNQGNPIVCGNQPYRIYGLDNLLQGMKEQIHPLLRAQNNVIFHEKVIAFSAGTFAMDSGEAANVFMQQTGANPFFLFAAGNLGDDEFLLLEFRLVSTYAANAYMYFRTNANSQVKYIMGLASHSTFPSPSILLNKSDFNAAGARLALGNGGAVGSISILAKKLRIYTC